MTFPLPLLLEAITSGGVAFRPSLVEGYCGIRNDAERVIAVDPTAPLEQVAEDLVDHLRALADAPAEQDPDPAPPDGAPHLSLVHSTERPERPDDDSGSDPQVVG